MTTSVKDSLVKELKKIERGTQFVLKAIPQDKLDYKPNENMRTLKDLAFHIATMPVGSAILADSDFTEFPPFEVLAKAMVEKIGDVETTDYADLFVRSSEYFINWVGKKSEEEFVNTTYQSFLMRQPATFLEGTLSMITHLIQHRGTLFTYLRLLDIPVSMTQYFGIKEL